VLRSFVHLTADTHIPVYNTGRKLLGHGILLTTWEALLQRLNNFQTLSQVNNMHLKVARNDEKKICQERQGAMIGFEPSV